MKSYLGIDTYLDRFKDCNLRPQGVLYLNDKLISGVDINHCDTLINEDGHYEMYLFMYIHDLIQSLLFLLCYFLLIINFLVLNHDVLFLLNVYILNH